jgi:hypothetical protein
MAGTSPAMTEAVSVARMERSEIRVSIDAARSFLDFAALHPGYLLVSAWYRRVMQAYRTNQASCYLVADQVPHPDESTGV